MNNVYLERGELRVEVMGRGFAWLDMGTHESLLRAANFVSAIQERQGFIVACLEEIAFRMGLIDADRLEALGMEMKQNDYGRYLIELAKESRS